MSTPDAPDTPESAESPSPAEALQHTRATWAARFGWLVGGTVGVALGFALTWLVETRLLAGRVADAPRMASRLSAALVPGVFVVGALLGEAFGRRGGAGRYRLLGAAAGVTLSVAAWLGIALAR